MITAGSAPMDLAGRFRDNLKRILEERSISQREFAEIVGVHEVTVSRWLTASDDARHQPDLSMVARVATALRLDPSQLLRAPSKKHAPAKRLTISEVADELGVSRQRVHQLCKKYGVKVHRVNPRKSLVDPRELRKIPRKRR